jgi:hypothetical protein
MASEGKWNVVVEVVCEWDVWEFSPVLDIGGRDGDS